MMKLKRFLGLAAAVAGAFASAPPASAVTSQSGTLAGLDLAPAFNVACRPGSVLVGVNGKSSSYVDSIQPVCANTTGSRWTTATYTGSTAGVGGVSAYSRVCPTNTAVKSISGRGWLWVDQIVVACQGLNDAGEFVGPVTTLPAVGGWGGLPKPAVACSFDQPATGLYGTVGPNGLFGIWGNSLHSIGMNCGTRMEGLKQVSTPTPSNLYDFVANKEAAIGLGKALFWDMQVGSDGKTACATCHFHAGADNRGKNSVSPGLARASSPTIANPDTTFQIGGPNHQFVAGDFPFFQRSNPDDPYSPVTRDVNDVASSQGVFNTRFISGTPGASADKTQLVSDLIFKVGSLNTRRVEPRNTPTTINAVFNFRNFWDRRAQYLFNGVNPFGARDPDARVFKSVAGMIQPTQVRIDNASLASQAVGPPSSIFEMSADGRTLMDIGRRILTARPLALQKVDPTDSVLGPYATVGGTGVNVSTYEDAIRVAFRPEWWVGGQVIEVDSTGAKRVVQSPWPASPNQYTQMQANFSLFFGLAIQLYESTLVSNDSPFDRYMAGDWSALNSDQLEGMKLFQGKGKCANCHGGAEFTNASVRRTINEPLQRMVMGNGGVAVYDEGFYNTAVTRTNEDLLNGGRDAFGKPLSNTAIAQQFGSSAFEQIIGIKPNIPVYPGERIAVMGAAKTSTVRNAELTQPFFHNGGALNLKQMIEFYNRGGNFKPFNINDVDPDIERLGLSATEKYRIIAFIKSLTDDRVRRAAAPFDHPELIVPNGHVGNESSVQAEAGRAADVDLTIPAIGQYGAAGQAEPNFLNVTE
jgi:cytochrome c peroxidase